METKKDVLLVNDLPGYGKMALAAMIPILSAKGMDVHTLPTALISNTFGFGKYDLLDTTEYMKNTLNIWNELGFSFDSIATGFVASDKQVELIKEYIQLQTEKPAVFVDPIMGDKGRLYKGVKEETVEHMRGLISVADVVMPNFTEAAFLIGETEVKDSVSLEEAREMTDKLRERGAKSVVITSVPLKKEEGVQPIVYGFDAEKQVEFVLPFDVRPVSFGGTGDVFSSVLIAEKMKGENLRTAVRRSMDAIEYMLDQHQNDPNPNSLEGFYLEKYLHYFLEQ